MYDIIGDIHGYASALKELLSQMDYESSNGIYRHSERKALFVGDYIDRGPEIPETLALVRGMVEAGSAVALMGNHEYNAIMYNEPDGEGGYLRPRTESKKEQHEQTLEQLGGESAAYRDYVSWFKTLPLYFENEDFRAVHATWDPEYIEALNKIATEGILPGDVAWEKPELDAIAEELLKGKEVALPEGITFMDKGDTVRDQVRVKWWLDPSQQSMKSWSINRVSALDEDLPVPPKHHSDFWYDPAQKPVFFGHYWWDAPLELQAPNVCCLDYSIAKGGKLVAYRFNGEEALTDQKLIWVQ